MYKNILFIVTIVILILVVLFLLYKLYQYYKKHKFINEIIEEWEKITNGGFIKQDKNCIFKDDYYLSINNKQDSDSHIHLIINDNIIKKQDNRYKDTCFNLCYTAKKYDLNSELHFIDQNKSPKSIVEDMYRELYFFKD